MANSAKFYLLLIFNLWQLAIATASFLLLLLPLYCFTYRLRMHLDVANLDFSYCLFLLFQQQKQQQTQQQEKASDPAIISGLDYIYSKKSIPQINRSKNPLKFPLPYLLRNVRKMRCKIAFHSLIKSQDSLQK